ncbi:UDP-N-acetylglucosamine diphosphorylase/glucosamine-1-phosphate N-acetyltransferase [Maribacter vaceletii]|uniref:UDP-N-acetylglucosamine diphosphorylase/glucosamine-1-phosphate N-acetyltransferase n=1 Tax=Maribacter vaceletii TaxID=1206816 RepID=A0A495E978_9FLAO|nr:GlmU family protein [Maribacter vaceletii]RKR13482.1 UDP-N-acetylglucosamine diphosphorylase/glucosamine-1-phosphate N-acetyltransferase [Maribacter vaceletii]
MNFILFDGTVRESLFPFTLTRPVADIRVGILTIREKWEKYLNTTTTTITEDYLEEKYPMVEMDENVLLNSSFIPNKEIVALVKELKENEAIFYNEDVIAFFTKDSQENVDFSNYKHIEYKGDVLRIENTWDIFSKNADALQADFDFITEGRESEPISKTNRAINPENIFLEEGAKVEFAILNATDGPIYVGKDAEIWEGSIVRGALALCEHATIKLGAKIYGATTVGPYSKIGGEVNNSVIFGYSSKGHDGFLGNSVLGEWCNLGADTNNSNLKNNYAKVKLWNYESDSFEQTGLQFCGLMMGDHSKTAINTMFNTGTVIGVNTNVYVPGFPRNFVPSFSWGGANGFTSYAPKKAFDVAKVVMARRGIEFTEVDANILTKVFELTAKWRKY